MIVAGEASGDLHASKLVKAMRDLDPQNEYRFFGCAGPGLRAAGVEAVVEADSLAIVGLLEIARALPMFVKARRALLKAARERSPDAVILVDFPDFNLKLAKSLKRLGLTVVYYISPQVWAWRKYRVSAIRRYVDLLLTILPFEKDWFIDHGVTHVEYVGSPLAREVVPAMSKADLCQRYELDPNRPIVAFLPGSRQKEIARIFPVMVDAARLLNYKQADLQFCAAAASTSAGSQIEDILRKFRAREGDGLQVKVIEGSTYDVLNAADAAAVTSGTATMEAGIIGTPLVIVYKTSAINYTLLEPLISVEHYGLINLIAGERVAQELIQGDLTAGSLSSSILDLLKPDVNAAIRQKLSETTSKLGRGGASKKAAEAIFDLLARRRN